MWITSETIAEEGLKIATSFAADEPLRPNVPKLGENVLNKARRQDGTRRVAAP
jgi:hypothetical protein